MKHKLGIALLALVLIAPTVSAELEHWGPTPIAAAIGGIGAGNINVYAQIPQVPHGTIGDTIHSSIVLTAPSATQPAITWSITHQHGCTTNSPNTITTNSAALFISNFDYNIELLDFGCSVEIDVQLRVGAANTLIYQQRVTIALTTADFACSTGAIALDPLACRSDVDSVDDSTNDGFLTDTFWNTVLQWSLFLIGAFVIMLGEYRGDFGIRAIGGLLLIVAAWQMPMDIPSPIGETVRLIVFLFGFYELLIYTFSDTETGKKIRTR